MDELKKDKKEAEKIITDTLIFLEEKYGIAISEINVFRVCERTSNGELIVDNPQVEITIKI